MNVIQTENPELPADSELHAAFAEITAVLERRLITHRSLQLATLTAMLALCIADAARLSDQGIEAAADLIVEASAGILRREVASAIAQLGRPN